jgi:hypothetical protein
MKGQLHSPMDELPQVEHVSIQTRRDRRRFQGDLRGKPPRDVAGSAEHP